MSFYDVRPDYIPIFCSKCGERIGWMDSSYGDEGIYRCDDCVVSPEEDDE